MSPTPASSRADAARGFSAVELLVAVSITGVLSSIAYPGFSAQIDRSRRADGIAALHSVQMAEAQWRANQPAYGSLADIGVAALSPAGRYALQASGVGGQGYEILASAQGVQARDVACRHLRLQVSGANEIRASGPDVSVANADAPNRRCWGL